VDIALGDQALQYVRTCLTDGRTLSRQLLERLDLSRGSISTRLPQDADLTHLSEFEWGGRLKPIQGGTRLATATDGRQYEMIPVPNSTADLAAVIAEFLDQADNGVAVLENTVGRAGDPAVRSARSRVVTFGDDVFHLACRADLGEIRLAVTEASTAFLLIGVLARVNLWQCRSPAMRTISEEDLIRCATSVETIFVEAFDGEAYLFWTRESVG